MFILEDDPTILAWQCVGLINGGVYTYIYCGYMHDYLIGSQIYPKKCQTGCESQMSARI